MRGWLSLGVVALLICVIGAPARAATGPPTLIVQAIGQGTVTGTAINCGGGNLSCYSAYGTDPTPVTLTASTTATGWSFDHWEDACPGSTTATCAVSVTGSKTATAVFKFSGAVQTSTLTVSSTHGDVANGSSNYTIDCDSSATAPAGTACSLTVFAGSTLTMTEAPDSGNVFQGWGGACSGSAPSCSVYLPSSQSVSAGFVTSASSTLSVKVIGNGSVSGGGISCGSGASCSIEEPSNATVTLTASPASGYALIADTGWQGDCTGSQSGCTLQMNGDRSVTATFAQLVPLSVTVTGSGSVTGGGIGCDGTPLGQTCTANEPSGTDVTLTASPGSGGTVFWSGCFTSAGNTCTISNIANATAVSVSFSGSGGSTNPTGTNQLTVTVHGDGYVVAAAGTDSIYCTAAGGDGCTASVPTGTTITLSAVPASRSPTDFVDWASDCNIFTSSTCTLTMSSPKSADATFVGGNTTYTLSAQAVGSGSISGAGLDCTGSGSGCSSPQAAGASVTLTATPDFGATFTGWTGACTGTTTTCTVSMTNAKSVTAAFSGGFGGGGPSLTVAVTGGGTVTADGINCAGTAGKTKTCQTSYDLAKHVTLSAKPSAGSVLSAWTGACTGAKLTCTLTVDSAKVVGAKFVGSVLTATHAPTVKHLKSGYRVTLWFHAGQSGAVQVVATRAGKVVARSKATIKAGGRHVLFTVTAPGRYDVTLTFAKRTLRWRVTV